MVNIIFIVSISYINETNIIIISDIKCYSCTFQFYKINIKLILLTDLV